MPFVVTSWVPKVHRASGSGRGKPSAIMHIGFFACFHSISLERSRFRNFYFSSSRSSETAGIANRPPRARISVDTQIQTKTLAAHARRGLIITAVWKEYRTDRNHCRVCMFYFDAIPTCLIQKCVDHSSLETVIIISLFHSNLFCS